MREWIITNGLGGFASSTDIGGMNARRYHGLLIAPTGIPYGRTLVLSKVDESIKIDNKEYELYTNEVYNKLSKGYSYQEKFEKEILPIYTFKVKDVSITKTVCMIHGKNAVIVHYNIINGDKKSEFNVTPIINFRDFHSLYLRDDFDYIQIFDEEKLQIDYQNGYKLNMGIKGAKYEKHENDIFRNMFYKIEKDRGFDAVENHYIPGTYKVEIKPKERKEITFVCAMDGKDGMNINEILKVDANEIIKQEAERIKQLEQNSKLLLEDKHPEFVEEIKKGKDSIETKNLEDVKQYNRLVREYIIASDNFIVKRKSSDRNTIIAGYPWFLDWGRDAFIAMEGLLLIQNRFKEAKDVILTFAKYTKDGLIPNGFSEYTDEPLYNSADASLLFIDAIGKYIDYTRDYDILKEENLYKKMVSIIDNYVDGITIDDNNIYLDERDYLIHVGTDKTQNTWMDAKVDGRAVTPRSGKPVEINAMWFNALRVMQDINRHLNKPITAMQFSYIAKKVKRNFMKLYYDRDKKYLYDIIDIKEDGQYINDTKMRPNQLFALGMKYPVLDVKGIEHKAVLQIMCNTTEKLLNKFGVKTLARGEEGYTSKYEGDSYQRDSSYHQGPSWPWLLGIYYDSLKNLIKYETDPDIKAGLETTLNNFTINIVNTFSKELEEGNTVGSISELYDSDDPNARGKGAFAQAWSVSEVFRILFKK